NDERVPDKVSLAGLVPGVIERKLIGAREIDEYIAANGEVPSLSDLRVVVLPQRAPVVARLTDAEVVLHQHGAAEGGAGEAGEAADDDVVANNSGAELVLRDGNGRVKERSARPAP